MSETKLTWRGTKDNPSVFRFMLVKREDEEGKIEVEILTITQKGTGTIATLQAELNLMANQLGVSNG